MRMGMREGVSKEGDIFICLMEWALLRACAEHFSNRLALAKIGVKAQ